MAVPDGNQGSRFIVDIGCGSARGNALPGPGDAGGNQEQVHVGAGRDIDPVVSVQPHVIAQLCFGLVFHQQDVHRSADAGVGIPAGIDRSRGVQALDGGIAFGPDGQLAGVNDDVRAGFGSGLITVLQEGRGDAPGVHGRARGQCAADEAGGGSILRINSHAIRGAALSDRRPVDEDAVTQLGLHPVVRTDDGERACAVKSIGGSVFICGAGYQ